MPATSSLHEMIMAWRFDGRGIDAPAKYLPPKITATCPSESLFFMSISRQTAALPPTKNESLFHLHIPSKSVQLLFSTESRMQLTINRILSSYMYNIYSIGVTLFRSHPYQRKIQSHCLKSQRHNSKLQAHNSW